MACQTIKKRRYRPRPGAVAAALQLGVTYSHLRRVVAGERQSKKILRQLRSLQAERAKGGHHNASWEDRATKIQ